MATTYEFNPNIHEAQICVEQRHVNERIKLWLKGHGADIDALGSGKGPAAGDYLMLTATYLGVLPNARQFTVTPTPPLSFNTSTGVLTFGITPLLNGGTGVAGTTPTTGIGSTGFTALAPIAVSSGQLIVWDNTAARWKATNELSVGGSTDYGFLMGSTSHVTGVAVRTLDAAYFDVNTGTANVTTIGNLRSLNALTAATQLFATGTTGSDFNISSVTATHTFNLPTASATVRGALSSADWTTFNAKASANDFRFVTERPHVHGAHETVWGVFPVARGGTNASDSPTSTLASIGFSNLAPQVSSSGRMIAWDQVAIRWTAVPTLATGDNTLLMGSTTLDLGVAVRTLDPTYFSVNTGTGVVSLSSVTLPNDYRLIDARQPLPHTHRASDIVWGTLGVAVGGTGITTVSQGDVLYAPLDNTISGLAKNTSSTRYLSNTGASNNPAWAQVSLSTGVTGTLPIGSGGTGATTKAAAFLALAPTHAGAGSLIVYDTSLGVTNWVVLGPGDTTKMLVYDDGIDVDQPVQWSTVAGDLTMVSGAFTIANDAVSNAKLAEMAASTIKGNATAGTANPTDLTASQVRTLLSLVVGTNVTSQNDLRLVDARQTVGHRHWIYEIIAGGTPSSTTFLRGDGSWQTPSGSAVDEGNLILATQVFGA